MNDSKSSQNLNTRNKWLEICLLTGCAILTGAMARAAELPPPGTMIPGKLYRDESGEIQLDQSIKRQSETRRANQQQNTQRESVIRISGPQLTLTWEEPKKNLAGKQTRKIKGYRIYILPVRYRSTPGKDRDKYIRNVGNHTRYTYSNIKPGKYTISIAAYDDKGIAGQMTHPIRLIVEK